MRDLQMGFRLGLAGLSAGDTEGVRQLKVKIKIIFL